MGTCVSKCYPSSGVGSGSSCSSPAAKPAASCNAAVAVHPLPLPLPGPTSSSTMAAASSSSSTTANTSSSSSSTTANTSSSSSSTTANTSSSSSTSSSLPRLLNRDALLVEWDVVVLDPHKKKPTIIRPHHHTASPAATSKRPRSVSPLAKKTHVDAQAWKKKKVVALDQRRRHRVLSTPLPQQVSRGSSPVPEDDLTNPLISMDCFIFL